MKRALLALLLTACAPLQPLPPQAPGDAPGDAAGLAARAQETVRKTQHEPSAARRDALAAEAVEAGQRCQQVAPATPGCDYALALALGVQVREHPSTAARGLTSMVELLKRAAAADPRLDQAGPERVLALVLLRAPGWPLGPGDAEAALEAAQRAVALFPDAPPNQLVLAEALLATGDRPASRAAAQRGLELARQAAAAGTDGAGDWVRDGERLVDGKAPR